MRRRSDHSGPKSLSRVDGVGCDEYFMVELIRMKNAVKWDLTHLDGLHNRGDYIQLTIIIGPV